MPPGNVYLSILEFRLQPGGDFGPHAHFAGVVYTVQGVASISLPGATARSLGPGQAAFLPALALHTHKNVAGQFGAGAIAAGLIVLVILLCAAAWLRGGRRRLAIAGLSILLIAGGIYPLIGTTTNDWYFIAVRPEGFRTGAMPRPDGWVFYASPDVDSVPAGPYLETLSAISVASGASYDAPAAQGPQMIVIANGTATVHIGDATTQLGAGGAALAQSGQTLAIVNQGSGPLKALDFAVISRSAST